MTIEQRVANSLVAQRLFLTRQVDFWLGEFDETLSVSEIRARVVDVVQETSDTRTFVLRPNSLWRGHRAGQFLTVDVEIRGVRARRCYSISSAPDAPGVSITVKRVPGGRVSNWLHTHVEPGHVLRIGAAGGDFVLPEPRPAKLLLLSGGSGVTPVMSMLRALARRGPIEDVVFLHYARGADDVIFRDAVATLAAQHRGLRTILSLDRFDEQQLVRLLPDFADYATFLCGPAGLTERVERMWAAAHATSRLSLERFAANVPAPSDPGGDVRLTLTGTDRTVAASGAATLLDALERAGEHPAHGCRMGICHTCTCRKRTGTVQNLSTGVVSSEPDEEIQLCISVPRSDVALAL